MQVEKKLVENTPGPEKYNFHMKDSIEYHNSKLVNASASKDGFNLNFQPNEKVCFNGMEKSFYLKESPGVGTYLGNGITKASKFKHTADQSFSRNARF